MTLLFFLRSPAGNTDTGQAPGGDTGRYWDHDDVDKPKKGAKKRREKLERQARRIALEQVREAIADAEKDRKKRKRKEEALLLLLMHEFEGYDD